MKESLCRQEMQEPIRPLQRPCPLCAGALGRLLGELRFEVFADCPVGGDFFLVACDHCGFVFYDTPSKQADFDRYYLGNDYYCTTLNAGSGGTTQEDWRRFQDIAARIAPYIPGPDAAIFDVGCAKGGLLRALGQRGFTRLFGVDLNPACVAYVQEEVGATGGIGSALELPFPEIKADVLVYSHIVEHVVDLDAVVAAAQKKLNPGGIICVEVPDASRYGEFSGLPYQDLCLEHINHFSPESLAQLFQRGGFALLSQGEFIVRAGPRGYTPCTWAIFRQGSPAEPEVSRGLEQYLRDYLNWSADHPVLKDLARLAAVRTPLYVWGISQFALLLLGQSPLGRSELRGFVDRDSYKQSRRLMGHPIQPTEVLARVGPEHAVLITALGYEDQIIEALKVMGFRGSVLTMTATGLEVAEGFA